MLERTTFLQPEPSLVQIPIRVPRPRRLFRNGASNAAAIRAFAAAQLHLGKKVRSLAKAAARCDSNLRYVRAAVLLIETGNRSISESVLAGHLPLLEAADRVRLQRKARRFLSVDEAVMSWRRWTPEQRAEFGRGAGISEIWDCAISPVINEERVAAE
jgi:hypothetical protein